MNNWNGLGRLTKDPEFRYAGEVAVCNFTIAIDKKYQKKGEDKKANFLPCVAFGKTAEFVNNYFEKGKLIALTGEVDTSSWEKEGKRYYKTEIKVEQVYFAAPKKQTDSQVDYTPVDTEDSLPF